MTILPPVAKGRQRSRSRFVAILVYTLRSCIPPKRWAAILLPCAGALLFGLLAYAIDDTAERAFANVAAEGIFGLVMPIAALVIGDAVLGAEMRSGTFQFTWLSPAPTWQIVLGRWLGGSIVALVTIAPSCALAAVIGGTPRAPAPRSSPPRSAASRTSPCSSPSDASRGVPRSGHWRSCSWSSGSSERRSPESPSSRRRGSRARSSSACSTTRRAASNATGSRKAGAPSFAC